MNKITFLFALFSSLTVLAAQSDKDIGLHSEGEMSDHLQLGRGDRFHWNGQAYALMAKQIVSQIQTVALKP